MIYTIIILINELCYVQIPMTTIYDFKSAVFDCTNIVCPIVVKYSYFACNKETYGVTLCLDNMHSVSSGLSLICTSDSCLLPNNTEIEPEITTCVFDTQKFVQCSEPKSFVLKLYVRIITSFSKLFIMFHKQTSVKKLFLQLNLTLRRNLMRKHDFKAYKQSMGSANSLQSGD